jgi:hypothetical protein
MSSKKSNTVNKTTQEHERYKHLWTRCRDVIKGQAHIKSKSTEYLPKLSGHELNEYQKYLQQALFYNATKRTFKALKGLIFRKKPVIKADQLQDFVKDCTMSGLSIEDYADEVTAEELKTSRFGVLVEYPNTDNSALSQAESEAIGNRPFFASYFAEDILDVRTKRIGNQVMTSLVRLLEQVEVQDPTDEFKFKIIEQVRVLDLYSEATEGKGRPRYRQRIFRKEDRSDWVQFEEDIFPKMNGQFIDEIPFFMVGGVQFREPHLIDLVEVNLSHYVAYADHRKGVSYTTRPQPYATGISDDNGPDNMVLGGGDFWYFPGENVSVGMLEYNGSGLTASENMLKQLVEFMASLGARMLMPDDQREETATKTLIKKQGENSALSEVSDLVAECLTKALKFAARWMGIDEEDISIELNKDFIPAKASPEDILKMIAAVQTGEYSEDDYLWWLEQNEMVNPAISADERRNKIETDPPPDMVAGKEDE